MKQRAESTITSSQEVGTELQKTKEQLDQCSALLNSKSMYIRTASSFTDRLFGKTYQNKREFKRQRAVLKRVSETLEEMQTKVPALLPNETRFLNVKPWQNTKNSVRETVSPIPAIHLRA
jgi:hypothetical protein